MEALYWALAVIAYFGMIYVVGSVIRTGGKSFPFEEKMVLLER